MRILVTILCLLAIIVSSGCQAGVPVTPAQPATTANPTDILIATEQSPSPTQAEATPERIEQPVTPQPERFEPVETSIPVTGEVPDEILNRILADLTNRSGVAPEQITVIRSQAIAWSDGSLGCPQPGQVYTQAIVDGYWVVLEAGGQEYDYHATEGGYFFLCENALVPGVPAGTPAQ